MANSVYSVVCQTLQTHDYLLSLRANIEASSTDEASLSVSIPLLFLCLPVGGVWYLKIMSLPL